MRRRINRTLLAATAASASLISLSFMAAGAAGAATAGHTRGLPVNGPSGGAAIVTDQTCTTTTPTIPANDCAMAGYQASNRLFRYAQASIVVPSHNGVVTGATAPASDDAAMFVALANNSNTAYDSARVGIMPCVPAGASSTVGNACPATGVGYPSGWEGFVLVREPHLTTVADFFPITVGTEGSGVFVSAYLSPTGNSVHTLITTPATTSTTGGVTTTTTGATYNDTVAVNGPVYTDALALADWTPAPGIVGSVQPAQPLPTAPNVAAYDQFFQGRFTTWNGTKGTFNGKWLVNPVEATVGGAAPAGTNVVTGPSYLWTNDKFPGDAFGVWIYAS